MLAPRYLQRAVNRILLVIGDEEYSQALEYTANLAVMCDAKVILLYAVKTPMIYPIGTVPTAYANYRALWNIVSTLKEHGRDLLDKASLELQRYGLEVETKLVKKGVSAERIICETAEEEECDLLVINDHHVQGLRGLFRRSISAQVAEKARCPVVVVK